MEDFADFYANDNIIVVDEDALSEAMSDFIIGLGDEILDILSEEQTEEFEEILGTAASDGDEALAEQGIECDYASGMNSKRKRKKFKNQAAYEKWFDKNEDDIEVFATRDLEEGDDGEWVLGEAMPAKRVRRDIQQKRKASREHRKVKAKKKIEGRIKRKTASFKRYKKKSKRLGKRGLTSTGARKRTFINKG